jgi:hypothetical protein
VDKSNLKARSGVPSLTYLAKVEMWNAKKLAMTKKIQNEKLAAEITRDPRWQSIMARDKELSRLKNACVADGYS